GHGLGDPGRRAHRVRRHARRRLAAPARKAHRRTRALARPARAARAPAARRRARGPRRAQPPLRRAGPRGPRGVRSVISLLVLGLAAGLAHVITGPDHGAALAPFSVEAQRRAWTVGLRWGAGHAAGIVAVAVVAVLAADRLDLHGLSAVGDYLVGGV